MKCKFLIIALFILWSIGISIAGIGPPAPYSTFQAHPITSNTLNCTATAGSIFSLDVYSGNISITTGSCPLLPSNCADKDIISYYPTQIAPSVKLNDQSFSAPGVTGGIVSGVPGGSCPALGSTPGSTQLYQFLFDKANNRWVESCPISTPNQPLSICGGNVTLSSGNGTLSLPCIAATGSCWCAGDVTTPANPCYVHNPPTAGSITVSGTGSDIITVECTSSALFSLFSQAGSGLTANGSTVSLSPYSLFSGSTSALTNMGGL